MKSSKRKISLAVALVITGFGASAAMAQTSLLGGGSTLVQPTITIEGAGVFTYFGVGSGAGQTAFLNNDPTKFTSVAPNGSTVTASGTVDFANSDAPLTTAQVTGYARKATDGALIQLPYIVTPITVPLVNAPAGNGPSVTVNGATAPAVTLNDHDLCGIFSGQITDWNAVQNPDNNNQPYTATSTPITVVYRADGSGTTDLLTAHLTQVCAGMSLPITFSETQNFASLFPGAHPPSNFVAATGSGGVANQLTSYRGTTTHAIGYLSPDFTNTVLAPSSAPAAANQLLVAALRNRNITTGTQAQLDLLPTWQNASAAVATAPQNVNGPSNPADATKWVPVASDPSVGYPIAGTSQIIVSQCYADKTKPSTLITFLTNHYNNNTALLHNNGFDVVPTGLHDAITNDILTNNGNLSPALNIGARLCNSIAGR